MGKAGDERVQGGRKCKRFAVKVEVFAAEQQQTARIEHKAAAAHSACKCLHAERLLRGIEENVRLGLAQIGANEGLHVLTPPADCRQHGFDLLHHARADFGRVLLQREIRIGVNALELDALLHPGEELGAQFLRAGRAETDRIRRAFAHRRAVVRPVRRQIEHVAGFEHPVCAGLKVLQDAQRRVLDQAAISLIGDLPAPSACALQQEDVVVVEMRTHSTAIDRVAHHQVIESCLRNEVEMMEQSVSGGQPQVQALHQHGPRLLLSAQAGTALRPALERPFAVQSGGGQADVT